MSSKGYYVYEDQEGRYYFMEATTQECSYEKPTDGPIYDPKTMTLWDLPQKKSHQRNKSTTDVEKNLSISNQLTKSDPEPKIYDLPSNNEKTIEEDLNETSKTDLNQFELDIPEDVLNFQPDTTKIEYGERTQTPNFVEDHTFLPPDISSSIHQFQIHDFARQFFRQHRTNHVFNRKRIALDALVSFSADLITEPLLEALDKNCTKLSLQTFKWILQYTGVIPTKSPILCGENIVNTLLLNPALRDEVYFQLIKQTSHTPSNEFLVKGMELFLILSTIFPSSRNSENWIKAHLSQMSKHPDLLIHSISQFSYIRFSSRCAIGKPKENLEVNYIKKIPQQVSLNWLTFGASIYEMLWNQRLKEPKLPIPFIIYYLSEHILRKGAEKTEGIFRLPGNLKKVDEMANLINDGKECILNSPLNDIASLFKKLFRELPDPVVPVNRVMDILNLFEDDNKDYITFAETLPKPHKMVLKYLVGFLQHLCKFSEITKMDAKNFSIVFGPNILQANDITEHNQAKKFAIISNEFLKILIEKWDTSDIYPLKSEYLSSTM